MAAAARAAKPALDVEALFQTKTIAEIREVEARLRHDADDKTRALRAAVGGAYRDLISSADDIAGIHASASAAAEGVAALREGLAALAAGGGAGAGGDADADAEAAAASAHGRLHALGSRMRYLLDAPEAAADELDARDFLGAARRAGRAAEVARALAAGPRAAAARFPLLARHAPAVRKLRGEVAARAGEWLAAAGGAAAPQLAAALAALALADGGDGAELLRRFLAARQAYVLGCLRAAAAAPGDDGGALDAASVVLADAAALVAATVAQAGELFLPLPGVSPGPAAARALAGADGDDAGASELLFGDGGGGEEGVEAAAWRARVDAAAARLAALPEAGVALECASWLEGLAPEFSAAAGALVARGAASGGDLLALETRVRRELDGWTFSLSATVDDAAGGDGGRPPAMRWPDVCQWVLGRAAPLWPALLEAPLLGRARELVAADFGAVGREVGALVAAAAAAADALPPPAPGVFHPGSWADAIELPPTDGGGGWGGAAPAFGAAGDADDAAEGPVAAAAWRELLAAADGVLASFDRHLGGALQAALDACHGGGAGAGGGADRSARAAVLEPFVQDSCAAAADAVAAVLAEQLAGGGAGGPARVRRALLAGRAALAVAERSDLLAAVLGPPDAWRAAAAAAAAAADGGAAGARAPPRPASTAATAAAPSPRLDAARRRFREVAAAAYAAWASWAAPGMAAALADGLAADPALTSDAPLRGWEDVAVGSGDAAVRFSLPSAPSPAALGFAAAAAREADRAGGRALPPPPLAQLRAAAAAAAWAALRGALAPGAPLAPGALSERGALQLLLDVRFLGDLLGEAPPPGRAGRPPPDAARAALEAELSGRLDPIDWATYEPHLGAAAARALQRASVLLGGVSRGGGAAAAARRAAAAPGAGAAPAAAAPADSNLLRLAPPAPRFPYLPASTPSAAARHAAAAARAGGAAAAAAPVAVATDAALLLPADEHYSFAALSGAAFGGGGGGGARAGGAGAADAAGWGSRLGLGDVQAGLSQLASSNLAGGLLSSLASFKKQ